MDNDTIRTWWPIIAFVFASIGNAAFTVARVQALEKRTSAIEGARSEEAKATRESRNEAFDRIRALENFRAGLEPQFKMLMRKVFNGGPHDSS